MGSSDGFIHEIFSGSDNAGASASFTFQTKYYDQIPGTNKHYQALVLDIDTNNLSVTPTVLYDVGDASEALSAFSTAVRSKKILKLSAARARKAKNVSLKLEGTVSRTVKSGTRVPSVRLFQLGVLYNKLKQRVRIG